LGGEEIGFGGRAVLGCWSTPRSFMDNEELGIKSNHDDMKNQKTCMVIGEPRIKD